MKITKRKLQRKLEQELGCTIQHEGYPCNSCFHDVGDEWNLKEHTHEYWLAVLSFRGDYPELPPKEDLIKELYNKL